MPYPWPDSKEQTHQLTTSTQPPLCTIICSIIHPQALQPNKNLFCLLLNGCYFERRSFLRWTWLENHLYFTVQLIFLHFQHIWIERHMCTAVRLKVLVDGGVFGWIFAACCKCRRKLYYKWRVIKSSSTHVQEFIWALYLCMTSMHSHTFIWPVYPRSLLFKQFALAQRLVRGCSRWQGLRHWSWKRWRKVKEWAERG